MSDAQVAALVLKAKEENPDMGAKRLVTLLKEQGTSVSLNAVKKILQDAGGGAGEEPAAGTAGTAPTPQEALASIGKVERRNANQGCGSGIFAKVGVKAGEKLFSVRPAISVVFDPAAQRVCGLCLSASAAPTRRGPARVLLRRAADASFGFVFDVENDKVVVTGVDVSSPNYATLLAGDSITSVEVSGVQKKCSSPLDLLTVLKGLSPSAGAQGDDSLVLLVDRQELSPCRTCKTFAICSSCASHGRLPWHAAECAAFSALPEGTRTGDTSITRFLLRYKATLANGDWTDEKENMSLVPTLQANPVALPQLEKLAKVAGLDQDTVANLIFQIRTNAMQIDRAGKAACALSVWVGYTNHSCDPNAQVVPDREGLVHMTALRSITPNEEVRFSYVDSTAPFEQRQQILKEHYGFECRCDRCVKEDPNKAASRAQAKLQQKRVERGNAAAAPDPEELKRQQAAADAAMAALLLEESSAKGSKGKKKK